MRTSLTIITMLILSVGLVACTPWPPHGQGGEAESFYQPSRIPPRDYAGNGFSRLSCQSTRLETLRLVGGEVKRPGLVRDASEAWARASRELNTGLYDDADKSLDEVDQLLYQLAAQLGAIVTEESRKRHEWITKGCPL